MQINYTELIFESRASEYWTKLGERAGSLEGIRCDLRALNPAARRLQDELTARGTRDRILTESSAHVRFLMPMANEFLVKRQALSAMPKVVHDGVIWVTQEHEIE